MSDDPDPFEQNREILDQIAERGADLTQPILVDFQHIFYDADDARLFEEAAENLGFAVTIERVDFEDEWDVTASKEMVPSCEAITSIEMTLAGLAERMGGEADGWGFLAPPPTRH